MSVVCSLGHVNPDGSAFCDECGEPLNTSAPVAVASQDAQVATSVPEPVQQVQPVQSVQPDPVFASQAPDPAFDATQAAPVTQSAGTRRTSGSLDR